VRFDPKKLAELEKRLKMPVDSGDFAARLEALGPAIEAAAALAALPPCPHRPRCEAYRLPGIGPFICSSGTCDQAAPMELEVEAEWEAGAPATATTTTTNAADEPRAAEPARKETTDD